MNGTNLFRLIVTALVIAWAAAELTPPTSTPFESYLFDRITAQIDEDGSEVLSQEDNLAEFKTLYERADALVKENADVPNTPYKTTFVALLNLANEESIDLSKYFADIRIRDIKNTKKKNKVLLTELLRRSKGEIRFGLDLNGGVAITFEIDESQLEDSEMLRNEQISDARQVILDRVDGLGVAEPVVRVKGDNLIEVQMPGITTKNNPDIAATIGAPALLEFKEVHRSARPFPGSTAPLGYMEMVQEVEDSQTGEITEERLYITRIPAMTGEIIEEAKPQINQTGGYEVTMDFNDEGRRQFAAITKKIATGNTPSSTGRLAIVLDGKLISSPTVREEIDSPSARITGNFTQREAIELSNALNNPLAIPLTISELYEVSPTLAEDARDASIRAGLYGGALVIIFMIAYYGLAGIIAMLTVAINLFVVIGALSSFDATLTLPGVAALVLTIGMAVDANILIFERIREEIKSGKSTYNAVVSGFDKAFSTIVDANATTLITALILVWLGTGPVKGFGVTLSAGIIATVFCSLVASRFLMEIACRSGVIKNPFRFQLFKDSNFEFLNYAKRAFICSWILVIVCTTSFILHIDQAFGIDFTGGDEVTLSYQEAISAQEINELAEAEGLGEVNTFFQTPLGSDNELMILQTEPGRGEEVFDAISVAYPEAQVDRLGVTKIGSAVGDNVTKSAIYSMIVALFAILIYIAFRFEFGFGFGALVATIHDVLMTIGVFVTLGELFGIGSGQFSAPMIAAILMTVGYSINDTIVVFDRIREELELNPGNNLKKVIHLSINRVLNRTVLTSLTTLMASLTLFIFGAGVIKDFALVFLIGILTGTFSSMFIASPVFYRYHRGDRKSVERGEVLPSYDWTAEENNKKA